ncbi:hypothetical protein MDA_GLEAN10006831 [Myotis davidii]|uniref:Uncharacterized protein n=1 Tax=Myotis davidii TaxID=225400 RepID=L5LL56_MYODS|nr:hypothetical protein MDA_GLEAN10006831 [Myotis davidii]
MDPDKVVSYIGRDTRRCHPGPRVKPQEPLESQATGKAAPRDPGATLPAAHDPDSDRNRKAGLQARRPPGTQEPIGEVCRQSSNQAMRGRVGGRRSYRSSSGRRLKNPTRARSKD